jgi:hypothetical protein
MLDFGLFIPIFAGMGIGISLHRIIIEKKYDNTIYVVLFSLIMLARLMSI